MNSCFHHSPFCYSNSSSQCSFGSPFLLRNGHTRRKNRTVMACLGQENPKDRNYCARRAIVFMGFGVIPVLNMWANGIENLTAENTKQTVQNQKQKGKQSVPESSSGNSFFSFLNGLGFLGSGVLSALYASTKKELDSANATIESMTIKLNEKDAAITSLEKKLKTDLLNENEAHKKVLAKANEEHQALLSQLNLANDTIKSIGHELQKQRKLAEELTFQVDDLEASLRGVCEEKTELQQQLNEKLDSLSALQERVDYLSSEVNNKENNLRNLNIKFAEKERELDKLSLVCRHSEDRVTNLNSEIGKLKDAVSEKEKEVEAKDELVYKLNADLSFSIAEKNKTSEKVNAVIDEYNNFKSSTEKKSASDAVILGEKEEKICEIEEQIKFAMDERKKNEGLISDLTEEKNNLKEMLDIELKDAEILEQEIKIARDAWEKSRNEAFEFSEQLQQSRNLCSELEKEISKVRVECSEAKELLEKNIFETKQESEILKNELRSVMELLDKSSEELRITSQELFDLVRKRDILEKELMKANEKAENAVFDLNEEKKILFTLNEELKILENQNLKDRELRKSLESDLDEASKSLDEMNRNALILSRELEFANSRISGLEEEKDAVLNALEGQKRDSREARENLEDAHDLVMRLGKERESLETRGNKLEDELASAKGEILRLKSGIKASKSWDNVPNQEKANGEGEDGVRKRKVMRRRKVKPKQEDDS
ncbi:mar-binding filament-like protein 1-1 [Phtheirospermum japonicum]|uniref:Mar-binding filament-like protein 1-1 n=1 Tax=Phtheirospermum japonicum TaxID=374723 RepID=A0A830CM60_9LAMI|nr:mar-binding filament-like protein 1-1 [Phtheirospermum japonicum]